MDVDEPLIIATVLGFALGYLWVLGWLVLSSLRRANRSAAHRWLRRRELSTEAQSVDVVTSYLRRVRAGRLGALLVGVALNVALFRLELDAVSIGPELILLVGLIAAELFARRPVGQAARAVLAPRHLTGLVDARHVTVARSLPVLSCALLLLLLFPGLEQRCEPGAALLIHDRNGDLGLAASLVLGAVTFELLARRLVLRPTVSVPTRQDPAGFALERALRCATARSALGTALFLQFLGLAVTLLAVGQTQACAVAPPALWSVAALALTAAGVWSWRQHRLAAERLAEPSERPREGAGR